MTLPTYDQFIAPLLSLLAAHPEGLTTTAAQTAVADALGLTEEQRAVRLPSGVQAVYRNRIGWAHDRLKRAGYSHSPKRGYWKLTEEGRRFSAVHPSLTDEQVQALALVKGSPKHGRTASGDGAKAKASAMEVAPARTTESPEDRLESAVEELGESVQNELLENIGLNSPAFFEQLVLDLLHKMGYGISRKDIERVGKSHDGGIDGVISLDRLGLEKVYVQAKRWQATVGRAEIQAFYGALAGQRARKGVFITTSDFSQQAVEFARSVEGVILINGERLTQLMIDFEVGVTPRIVKVPRVDLDYFEE
jgi:restriction system protein